MSDIDLNKCEFINIHRSKINLAEYNPRKISSRNRNNLKKILKKHGLVSLLVWNEKTSNLVSGHQRLSIIDDDKGNLDYNINVLKINVDEKEEKAINVSINNNNAKGEYDFDLLSELSENNFDLKNDGFFNDYEIKDILNINEYLDKEIIEGKNNFIPEDEFFDKKKKMREKRKEVIENDFDLIDVSGADYILTVVFDSNNQKKQFLNSINKEINEKYIHYKDIKYE